MAYLLLLSVSHDAVVLPFAHVLITEGHISRCLFPNLLRHACRLGVLSFLQNSEALGERRRLLAILADIVGVWPLIDDQIVHLIHDEHLPTLQTSSSAQRNKMRVMVD